MDRTEHAQTRAVDGDPSWSRQCTGNDWRWRGLRLFGRHKTPGAALDATSWARVAVSPVVGATPFVAALCLHCAGLRVPYGRRVFPPDYFNSNRASSLLRSED